MSVSQASISQASGSQRLWDFAGFDGLALARCLFGASVSDLSVFQSLETEWVEGTCALLRLSETNFRIAFDSGTESECRAREQALQAAAAERRVWAAPSRLVSFLLDDGPAWERLNEIGAAKPPHRLAELPLNRAVPISLKGTAALAWRHPVLDVPRTELQIAPAALEEICRLFRTGLFLTGH